VNIRMSVQETGQKLDISAVSKDNKIIRSMLQQLTFAVLLLSTNTIPLNSSEEEIS